MSAIAPKVPLHLLRRKSDNEETENEDFHTVTESQFLPELPNKPTQDSDEDDYVPALPPDILAARSIGPPTSTISTGKRLVGPSVPSVLFNFDSRPHSSLSDDDDDDEDDDDVGPKPLPTDTGFKYAESDAVIQFIEKEERRRQQVEEAAKLKPLKRDEWMLVPPSSSDLLGKLDPTKLKPRQFSRSTAPAQKKLDNSLWTETPAERQQRLADEVSGRKRRAIDGQEEDIEGTKKRRKDEDMIRRGVDEYAQRIRGPALIEQHASTSKPEDTPDTNTAIWDHSRDMSMGGRLMDSEKRNKLIREAKGLGDRFGTGKNGGFL